MLPTTLLLATALALLAVLAFYDSKTHPEPPYHRVPHWLGYVCCAVMGAAFFVVLLAAPLLTLVNAVLGFVFFLAIDLGKVLRHFAAFDRVVVLALFLVVPFVALFAMLLQQAVIIAKIRRQGSALYFPVLTYLAACTWVVAAIFVVFGLYL